MSRAALHRVCARLSLRLHAQYLCVASCVRLRTRDCSRMTLPVSMDPQVSRSSCSPENSPNLVTVFTHDCRPLTPCDGTRTELRWEGAPWAAFQVAETVSRPPRERPLHRVPAPTGPFSAESSQPGASRGPVLGEEPSRGDSRDYAACSLHARGHTRSVAPPRSLWSALLPT